MPSTMWLSGALPGGERGGELEGRKEAVDLREAIRLVLRFLRHPEEGRRLGSRVPVRFRI